MSRIYVKNFSAGFGPELGFIRAWTDIAPARQLHEKVRTSPTPPASLPDASLPPQGPITSGLS